MGHNADTNYSFNPWMNYRVRPGDGVDPSPMTSAGEVLAALVVPSDAARMIRPPVGNEPFPPRVGYEKRPLTVMDALTVGQQTLLRDTPTRQDTGPGPI